MRQIHCCCSFPHASFGHSDCQFSHPIYSCYVVLEFFYSHNYAFGYGVPGTFSGAVLEYQVSEPIPLLIYDSHNDFEDTNAIYGLIGEGTLGVTEAFKNRMVLPFTGSYTQFRHVIHHELVHAFMFDMFYRREGGLASASRLYWGPPLWFAEGLAEYCSSDWTTEKNMWVRGAVIDGYLNLDGYQAYTAGYSLLRWIADEFGEHKVAAVTRRMAIIQNPADAFTAELGITLDEFRKLFAEAQAQGAG